MSPEVGGPEECLVERGHLVHQAVAVAAAGGWGQRARGPLTRAQRYSHTIIRVNTQMYSLLFHCTVLGGEGGGEQRGERERERERVKLQINQ